MNLSIFRLKCPAGIVPVIRMVVPAVVMVVLSVGAVLFGAGMARADVDPAAAASLEQAVDSEVGRLVPNVFRNARATYLNGYGVIVTIEVALETPRNPFSSSRSPADVRASAEERISAIRERAIDLLRSEGPGLDGLGADEMVSVIVYLVNPNPVDLSDLPREVVVAARKQDALDFQSGALTARAFADRAHLRED